VSGIDTSDPNSPQVIVSDPGLPGWHAEDRYPLDQFLQAWKASDFFMVATQEPAPDQTPGMENFDYSAGHIDQVAGMPYDQFTSLSGQPGAFDSLLDAQTGTDTGLTAQGIMDHAQPDGHAAAGLGESEHSSSTFDLWQHADQHPYAAVDAYLHGDIHDAADWHSFDLHGADGLNEPYEG
jgi:hypothetical protein